MSRFPIFNCHALRKQRKWYIGARATSCSFFSPSSFTVVPNLMIPLSWPYYLKPKAAKGWDLWHLCQWTQNLPFCCTIWHLNAFWSITWNLELYNFSLQWCYSWESATKWVKTIWFLDSSRRRWKEIFKDFLGTFSALVSSMSTFCEAGGKGKKYTRGFSVN